MEIGTDAATDVTLDSLDKGFRFDDAVCMNDRAVELGIPCAHYVMFGGPGETEETVMEGLENMERLRDCVAFAFQGIRILPETALYEMAVDQGIVERNASLLEPVFYFSPDVDREFTDRAIKKAWYGIMERIYPCSETEERVRMLHRMGYTGPMWDALIRHRLKKRT
jgi:radical SAM superfamily enzyme YgiQ (UPF0313 family)